MGIDILKNSDAPRRLARYKKHAAESDAKAARWLGSCTYCAALREKNSDAGARCSIHAPTSWCAMRYDRPSKIKSASWARHTRGDYAGAYFSDEWPAVYIGAAADITRDAASGWYNDDFNSTTRPHVLAIRTPRGIVYIPGVDTSDADGVTVWPRQQYAEKNDAARRADKLAERIADKLRRYYEIEREYNDARDTIADNEARIMTARDDIRDARARIAALHRDLLKTRADQFPAVICGVIRDAIGRYRIATRAAVVDIRDARARIVEWTKTAAELSARLESIYGGE
jgi:hypothetical protein